MEDYLMHSRYSPKYYAKEGKGPNALYFYSAHAYQVWKANQGRAAGSRSRFDGQTAKKMRTSGTSGRDQRNEQLSIRRTQRQKTLAEIRSRNKENAEHDAYLEQQRKERARQEQMRQNRIAENAEHDAYNEQRHQAREAGTLEPRESTQPIKTTLFQFLTGAEASKGLISAKREMKRNAKDIKRAEKKIAKLEDTLAKMKMHRQTRTPRYAKLEAELLKQQTTLEEKQKVTQPLVAKFNAAMNYYTKATLPGMLSSDLKTGSKKVSDILAKSGNSLSSSLNPTIVLKKRSKG